MYDESYILENKDNVLLVEFPAFYSKLIGGNEYGDKNHDAKQKSWIINQNEQISFL